MFYGKPEQRRWRQQPVIWLLSWVLLGCHAPISGPQTQAAPTQAGQVLPISAQAKIGQQVINLEVAQTPRQQALGLMYRRSLAPNQGMLFAFDPPRPVSFWMKNTKIPLDMIFLRQGKVMAIVANVPPCTATPCPVYGPEPPVAIDQVIELRGGRSAELGLAVGDRVSVTPLPKAP
jgi:uncharacterized membrane protein (UPF0127 family)